MFPQRATIAVTTDASGDATGYSENITGQILEVHYTKTDFDDGSTFAVTLEKTGETVWSESAVNASTVRRPRQTMHDSAGADQTTYAETVAAVNDRVKWVVSSGGNVKSGTLEIVYA